MNKTIERVFYVSDECGEHIRKDCAFAGYMFSGMKNGITRNKIKIIIEVPEKKVTISESEFDDAIKYADKNHAYTTAGLKYFEVVKQRLFSGDEG